MLRNYRAAANIGDEISFDVFMRNYCSRFEMQRTDKTYGGGICICNSLLLPPDGFAQQILSVEEQRYFNELAFGARKLSYLVGRYSAKKAVSVLTDDNLGDIHIEYGVFNNPLIDCSSIDGRLEISIAHTSNTGAAIAFPSLHPMGIDVEQINIDKTAVIESELTANEIKLFRSFNGEYPTMLTAAWTIKEALSKVLKTGLTASLSIYEIASIVQIDNVLISKFTHFTQYKTLSFVLNDNICSIAYPRKTDIKLDLSQLLKQLS